MKSPAGASYKSQAAPLADFMQTGSAADAFTPFFPFSAQEGQERADLAAEMRRQHDRIKFAVNTAEAKSQAEAKFMPRFVKLLDGFRSGYSLQDCLRLSKTV